MVIPVVTPPVTPKISLNVSKLEKRAPTWALWTGNVLKWAIFGGPLTLSVTPEMTPEVTPELSP